MKLTRLVLVHHRSPIVDPGRLSKHMHRIMGGSNFAAGYSYENNRASDCSTVYTPFDMSNYWRVVSSLPTPIILDSDLILPDDRTAQMYWASNDANEINADTTYTSVPAGHRVSLHRSPSLLLWASNSHNTCRMSTVLLLLDPKRSRCPRQSFP